MLVLLLPLLAFDRPVRYDAAVAVLLLLLLLRRRSVGIDIGTVTTAGGKCRKCGVRGGRGGFVSCCYNPISGSNRQILLLQFLEDSGGGDNMVSGGIAVIGCTFWRLFLALGGLLSGLGDLATGSILEAHRLDDTDSDGLSHVTYGETSQRRELLEGLNAQRLRWDQNDDSSIARLDRLRVVLSRLAGTTVHLLLDLGELARNVGGVAIEHRRVTVGDLTRVVQHDNLGGEVGGTLGWVVLGITSDVTTTQFLDRDVLDVETNVVSGDGLLQSLVVHLHGLDFSGQVDRGEDDDGTRLEDTSLHTTDRYCSDTTDFVDILQRQTQGLVGGTGRGQDGIQSLDQALAVSLAFLALDGPSLEPRHLGGRFQHVVAVPAGDRDERDGSRVVTDLLDVGRHLLLDFLETGLIVRRLGRVHLVDTNDELLDTESEGQQGVLTGLSVLGDTGLELAGTGSDDQHGAISLRRSCDHVLDEITMSGGVDDGDVVLGGFELPEGDIDGDTTLALSLQLVQDPCVLEGTLTHFLGFLLELLDRTLVDTAAFVDQMTGGGRLARIDVSDDDDVNMSLLLTHFDEKFLNSTQG
uniref:Putative secreted protein n=1 Tax=Anopheles darlingi TaxID=43151 RepID=A0A2M4DKJ5_ANODA